MSAVAQSAAETGRLARLRALGVQAYRLRGPAAAPAPEAGPMAAGDGAAAAAPIPCVLLLPEACPAPAQARVDRAMQAFGARFARAPRVRVPAAGLRQAPPPAHAYLAFGEVQARALGQTLTADAARQVEVVLLDAPEQLGQGAAKQRLWLALKGLRRRLAEG